MRILIFIAKVISRLIPINKKMIILESHSDFTDSTFALYTYLRKTEKYKNHKIYWFCDKANIEQAKSKGIYPNIIFYNGNKKDKLKRLLFNMRCKFYIYTHMNYMLLQPKKKQFFINLWHGVPFKKWDVNFNLIKNQYRNCLFVTSNEFTKELRVKNYIINPNNIIFFGNLRNDFFRADFMETNSDLIKGLFNIQETEKVIVCLPTIREKSNYCDSFPFSASDLEKKEIDDLLAKNQIKLIIKLHPGIKNSDLKEQAFKFSNIITLFNNDFIKKGCHLYQLLSISDALISDYSSVSFDYLLLDKPIGYAIEDYDKFLNNQGFVVENPSMFMAGMLLDSVKTFKEFIFCVANNIDDFSEKRKFVNLKYNYIQKDEKKFLCQEFIELLEKL